MFSNRESREMIGREQHQRKDLSQVNVDVPMPKVNPVANDCPIVVIDTQGEKHQATADHIRYVDGSVLDVVISYFEINRLGIRPEQFDRFIIQDQSLKIESYSRWHPPYPPGEIFTMARVPEEADGSERKANDTL